MSRILAVRATSITLIMFLLSIFLTTFVPSISAAENQTYDEIFRKYNLQTASEIPEGIKPIKVNSEKELARVLENIDNSINEHANKERQPVVIDLSKNRDSDFSPLATNTYVADYVNIGVPGYGKIELKVRVSDNGSYITSVIPFTNLTGFSLGFDWNETICSADIVSNGKDVRAWAEGELEYYLIIDGMIKVYSRTIELYGYLTIFH